MEITESWDMKPPADEGATTSVVGPFMRAEDTVRVANDILDSDDGRVCVTWLTQENGWAPQSKHDKMLIGITDHGLAISGTNCIEIRSVSELVPYRDCPVCHQCTDNGHWPIGTRNGHRVCTVCGGGR